MMENNTIWQNLQILREKYPDIKCNNASDEQIKEAQEKT